MARTIQEKAIDRLFALYVVNRCKNKHKIDGVSETKLQKVLFYTARKLNQTSSRVLNYCFVKANFPTFSGDLRDDLNDLASLGFLDGPYFKEQTKAEMILEDFKNIFEENKRLTSLINREVDKYAPVPTTLLVAKTRRLRWRHTTIEKLPKGTPIIVPLKRDAAERKLKVSDKDLEDLAICLSPIVSANMQEASEELTRGKRLTHEEVFGELC